MNKKWATAVGMMLLFVFTANVVLAADGVHIFIHGNQISSDVPAKIEDGTTMVPLRVIAERLNQNVQWDPDTQTVTVEQRKNSSTVERLIAQRNTDIIVSDDPANAARDQNANTALMYNLETLYNELYRGYLQSETDAADGEIKTEEDIRLFSDSLAAKEGSVAEKRNFIRLVKSPHNQLWYQNEPSRKDILFYLDSANADDLFMAVQNPKALTEWKVYRAEDYGSWFIKQLNLYFMGARGFYEDNDGAHANLTDKEARDILKELVPKALDIQEGIFNGGGSYICDENQTIPGEEDYCLITGERQNGEIVASGINSIADLKKVVEDVFTKDYAQSRFYRDYLETVDGGLPLYKEYNGQLYVNSKNGGHGWATKIFTDTAEIKYQKNNVVYITLDTTLFDEPNDTMMIKMKQVDGKWLLDTGLHDYVPNTK